MPIPTDQEFMILFVQDIHAATTQLQTGDLQADELPTAASLARKYNYRLETVKKKLGLLKDTELIQTVGVTPKRYRFNAWALRSLDPDSPMYGLFCDPESPSYIEQ